MPRYNVSYELHGSMYIEANSKEEAEEELSDSYFPDLLNNVEYDRVYNVNAVNEDEDEDD